MYTRARYLGHRIADIRSTRYMPDRVSLILLHKFCPVYHNPVVNAILRGNQRVFPDLVHLLGPPWEVFLQYLSVCHDDGDWLIIVPRLNVTPDPIPVCHRSLDTIRAQQNTHTYYGLQWHLLPAIIIHRRTRACPQHETNRFLRRPRLQHVERLIHPHWALGDEPLVEPGDVLHMFCQLGVSYPHPALTPDVLGESKLLCLLSRIRDS